MQNRIYFKGSPWPDGHIIKEFFWSGRIDETGIWFDLHLQTKDYDANDDPDESYHENEKDNIDDWESKTVWCNYHNCILSSTYWGNNGFLVGTNQKKLDFDKLVNHTFHVDPLNTYDFESPSFHIYLQGHDAVAGHKIQFQHGISQGVLTINWKGKIALVYLGDDEFKHDFEATIINAKFEGIAIPDNISDKSAHELLEKYLIQPEKFVLFTKGDQRYYVLSDNVNLLSK